MEKSAAVEIFEATIVRIGAETGWAEGAAPLLAEQPPEETGLDLGGIPVTRGRNRATDDCW